MSEKKAFSSEKKYRIVKEVLSGSLTVSEACSMYGMGSTTYYRWQDKFLNGAKASLDGVLDKGGKVDKEKSRLESEVKRLQYVVSELSAEVVESKKKNLI